MGKGMPYSHKRGSFHVQEIVKLTIPVDQVVNVAATGAAIGWGTGVIQGLPEGNILFLGAVANLRFSGPGASADLVDTWNGDYGLGSTPADDATITVGDVDLIPSTAVGPAVSEVSPFTRGESVANSVIFDNTDGSLELNLNILVDAADITDDTNVDLTVDGIVVIAMILLGDD